MPKLDRILTQGGIKQLIWKDSDALSVFFQKTGYIHVPDRFGYLNQFSKWDYVEHNHRFPSRSYTGMGL